MDASKHAKTRAMQRYGMDEDELLDIAGNAKKRKNCTGRNRYSYNSMTLIISGDRVVSIW